MKQLTLHIYTLLILIILNINIIKALNDGIILFIFN
jgi:hypothetical protein